MDQHEVLLGFVIRQPAQTLGSLPPPGPSPRAALEQILAAALAQPPCIVNFSGGRDSSALLAVALDVARRRGLPEPTAFTLRYTGALDADETSWQQLVVDQLKPLNWEVVDVDARSAEFLGPVATTSLEAHGLVWPPTLHLETAWLGHMCGATVITGEGGDEILGYRRATPLRAFLNEMRHRPGTVSPRLLRQAITEAAPARVRAASVRRNLAMTGYLSWLRPPLRERALREIALWTVTNPWSWTDAVRSHIRSESLLFGLRNRDLLAATFGARFLHPFLQPTFVDAVARDGGRLGYGGRTDAMRRIFSDLLPDAVLARRTKASFNTVFHGRATRAFARRWDGSGVDPAAVDVEVLRSSWLAERVHPGTTPLLQAAWLASGAP
jgi:asparagine synthetase B (glutamine-hydrolysing)